MSKLKSPILSLLLSLLVAAALAQGVQGLLTENVSIMVKKGTQHSGDDKSSTISASINGHTLTIVFTENLGQVSIEVSYASGNEVETTSIYTPSGVIIYIPYSGSYIVTFTLPNGDEYYGEFDVTD